MNFEKIGLTKNEKPTYAALLLFGHHKTNIHIGRFKTPELIIDDILINSPLFLAVDEAIKFIQKNISVEYVIGNNIRRTEKWQYPIPVLRELLLNAVIHKDYRNQTDVTIKIFDDSIIFTNPGKLFGNTKIEDLFTDYYIAKHRNKLLCEAFYLLGEIEKYGTGFLRIRKILENYSEISLNLEQINDFFKATIKTDQEADQETDIELSIIELIIQNKNITINEMSDKIGKGITVTKQHIKNLRENNKIKRVGSNKGGHWQILE